MPNGIVTLKGRIRTNDPAATTTWTKLSGSGTASFSPSANVAQPTVTISAADTYVFRLTVVSRGTSYTDDVTVTVKANSAPVVSAGPDVTGLVHTAIGLAGSATDDGLPTPSVLNVTWSKVSGNGTPTFDNPHAAKTNVTLDRSGTYVLRLTATDGSLTTTDDVTVTVTSLGTTYAAALPSAPLNGASLDEVEFRVWLGMMPAGWWSAVSADGSDIRVSDLNENQLPCDVIHFNKGGTTGFVVFKGTAGPANTCYKIWCGGAASVPAVDSTFGQYNAYRGDTVAFYPDGIVTDRTRNAYNLTNQGATTAAGPLGLTAAVFGTGHMAYRGLPAGFSGALSVSVVAKPDFSGDVALCNVASSGTGSYAFLGTLAATGFRCRSGLGSNAGVNYCECDIFAPNFLQNKWSQFNARFPSGGTHDAITSVGAAGQSSLLSAGIFDFVSVGATGDGTSTYGGTSPVCLVEITNSYLSDEYLLYLDAMLNAWEFWNCDKWALNSEPSTLNSSLMFPADWNHYATATPTNPSGTLTDFSMQVDLSVLPVSWWNAATVSGADIRVTDSSNTLLPFDLINYNIFAKTGLLVFKLTKTTSSQPIRIWQRSAGAARVQVADAIGRNNAYASHVLGFYPDGSGFDRTVNKFHLTQMSGGLVIGGAAGMFSGSVATDFNGSTQGAASLGNSPLAAHPFSFTAWMNADSLVGTQLIECLNSAETLYLNAGKISATGNGTTATTTPSYSTGTWTAIAAVITSTSSTAYLAGGSAATASGSNSFSNGTLHVSGTSGSQFFDGRLCLVSFHSTNLSAGWVAYVASMGNQATFWGSWSYV